MPDRTTTESDNAAVNAQGGDSLLQLVSFVVGGQTYAVPIDAVQEISRPMTITHVDESSPFLCGVVSLRRKTIPAVDLRQRFATRVNENTGDERILFVEVQSGTYNHIIGLIVDEVTCVLHISREIIEPATTTSGTNSTCVQGVAKLDEGLLNVLSLDQLFSQREIELAVSACGQIASAQAA